MIIELKKLGEFNPIELARLAKIIKGPITSAAFARRLGVTPAATSRILNAKISGPISKKNIVAMAHLITPSMGITMDELFRADGFEQVKQEGEVFSISKIKTRKIEDSYEQAILEGLNADDMAWRYIETQDISIRNTMTARFNLVLESDNCRIEAQPFNSLWAFCYLDATIENRSADKGDFQQQKVAMRFVERISRFSLIYAQINEEDTDYGDEHAKLPARISFVVSDKSVFRLLKRKFGGLRVPMAATLILLNLKDTCVEEELPLCNLSGNRYEKIFDDAKNPRFDNEISDAAYEKLYDEMINENIREEDAYGK